MHFPIIEAIDYKSRFGQEGITMRKRSGFTLIELLIVLAVIAALIATMTPLALNAIRRSQASKVAQNIKILANMLEVAAYSNGLNDEGAIAGMNGDEIRLKDLVRDLPNSYALLYDNENGKITATISTSDRADLAEVQRLLPGTQKGNWGEIQSRTAPGKNKTDDNDFFHDIPDGFKTESNGEFINYFFSFHIY
ncbi:MAG: Uncharacterized protein XE05_1390 [Thermotogales bacterium 46_20]|nr:MAG: Uncharacterized protein XE05_1390 [Thermotogales bacterium 46_20]